MKEIQIENQLVKVGDGCTIRYYSDRKPATIIEIADNGKTIKVQEDTAIRMDDNGESDCQSYDYYRNYNGSIHTFKQTRKDKNVYTDNGKYDDWGTMLLFGFREKYFDYSF